MDIIEEENTTFPRYAASPLKNPNIDAKEKKI